MWIWRVAGLAAVLGAVVSLAGCEAPAPSRPRPISFVGAEQTRGPVTIEGTPLRGSFRTTKDGGSAFILREESSAREMRVRVPPGVQVPENLESIPYVHATGTYDPEQRMFVATEVRPR